MHCSFCANNIFWNCGPTVHKIKKYPNRFWDALARSGCFALREKTFATQIRDLGMKIPEVAVTWRAVQHIQYWPDIPCSTFSVTLGLLAAAMTSFFLVFSSEFLDLLVTVCSLYWLHWLIAFYDEVFGFMVTSLLTDLSKRCKSVSFRNLLLGKTEIISG